MKKYYNKNSSESFEFATHEQIEADINYFKKYKYNLMDYICVNGNTLERKARRATYDEIKFSKLMELQKEIITIHEHIKYLESIIS